MSSSRPSRCMNSAPTRSSRLRFGYRGKMEEADAEEVTLTLDHRVETVTGLRRLTVLTQNVRWL